MGDDQVYYTYVNPFLAVMGVFVAALMVVLLVIIGIVAIDYGLSIALIALAFISAALFLATIIIALAASKGLKVSLIVDNFVTRGNYGSLWVLTKTAASAVLVIAVLAVGVTVATIVVGFCDVFASFFVVLLTIAIIFVILIVMDIISIVAFEAYDALGLTYLIEGYPRSFDDVVIERRAAAAREELLRFDSSSTLPLTECTETLTRRNLSYDV